MMRGFFEGNVPFVSIIIAAGQSVQKTVFVLDTGFTGDIQVTPKIAKELNLIEIGATPVRIANGQRVFLKVALAIANMEGISNHIEALISDGMPLAGISLLSKFGYKAIVDCKLRTVTLEKST